MSSPCPGAPSSAGGGAGGDSHDQPMPGRTPDGFSQQALTKLSPAPTVQRQPDVAPFKTIPMLAPHGHKRIPPVPPHPPHPRNVRQQHRAAVVTASLSSHLRRRRRWKGPRQSGRTQFGRTAGRRRSAIRKTAAPDKLTSQPIAVAAPGDLHRQNPTGGRPRTYAGEPAHRLSRGPFRNRRLGTQTAPTYARHPDLPSPPAVPPGSLTDPAYRAGTEQSIKPPVTPLKTLRRQIFLK